MKDKVLCIFSCKERDKERAQDRGTPRLDAKHWQSTGTRSCSRVCLNLPRCATGFTSSELLYLGYMRICVFARG